MITMNYPLPIVLDQPAFIIDDFSCDDPMILTCNGVKVMLSGGSMHSRAHLHEPLRIDLKISSTEFFERYEKVGLGNCYTDIVILENGNLGVYITTEHDVIYDEVHEWGE